jgi:hypothetical protein
VIVSSNINAREIGSTSLASLELGKSIYQKGILPNGKPLVAHGKHGQPFVINKTACIDCHRRSGLGTSESGILIAPITREYLFITGKKIGRKLLDRVGVPRPIYNEETLKLAITTGVKPNGRQLHEIMPRYKFSDDELNHLIVYLKSLNQAPVPGLTDTQIDFATVVTPDMSKQDKELMLSIINTYFANINKDVRQLGHMKNPLHGRYKPYRKWKLHVWELIGEQSSWKSQLETKYAKQPVFSILSGYGDWQPIHDFCEKNKIPSLFPITDTPVVSNDDFYTLYFSKGLELDAEVLASEIKSDHQSYERKNILQLLTDDFGSRRAAETLKSRLQVDKLNHIDNIKITSSDKISSAYWQELKEKYKPDALVLWLGDEQALSLLNMDHSDFPEHIYLSSRLLKEYEPEQLLTQNLPEDIKERVSIVHPFYLKSKNRRHLIRTKAWARSKKIDDKREHIMANTYFSLALMTGAIHTSRYNLNREYLLEQFEHMIDNTVYRSIYPHLSLGPDQRYASKGAYILKASPELSTEWVVPSY